MVRWAVLGAGKIARRFIASLAHETNSSLIGISGRNYKRAQEFARELKASSSLNIYESHEALIADEKVDAVYIALPHALHLEWVLRALRAGKAVLCEKPACLSASDMLEVAELAQAKQLLFMEAMKCRFVPAYAEICEAARQISTIQRVETSLCNDMASVIEAAGSYHVRGAGAGVLYDSGIYCASWIEDFLPGIPELISLDVELASGVDYYVDAHIKHGTYEARLECGFDRSKPRIARIVGDKGYIEVEELHRPERAQIFVDGKDPYLIEKPYVIDDFYGEISHFVQLMLDGRCESDIMPLKDSLHAALILDCIREGMKTSTKD